MAFLDLNAFFASCEQQEKPGPAPPARHRRTDPDGIRRRIAASYAAKAFGIKTGTLVREARQLCPAVIPVQANHRLYTEYHEHILKAVDTCLPVEKVCSIDEMACRLMGTERQVPVARELALKVKRALREQVGECLTCSFGIAPNVFLSKVGSDLQKPNGLVVITKDDLPGILLGLEELWQRVPRYKPLSAGVVLLDLVPADQHQPDLFAADTDRRQKLSPLIDRINDRYGRCAIGFGLFPPDVRAFKGHAAFHRVPERWEF